MSEIGFYRNRREAVSTFVGDLCWLDCREEGWPLYLNGQVIVLCQAHHRERNQSPTHAPTKNGKWPWVKWAAQNGVHT